MDLSKLFSTFLYHLRAGVRRDPERDWLVLFTLTCIAFVCIVVWNMWAFSTVASGGTIGKAATSTPHTFNRSTIDTIHDIFKMRAGEEARYISGAYRYTDPSQ